MLSWGKLNCFYVGNGTIGNSIFENGLVNNYKIRVQTQANEGPDIGHYCGSQSLIAGYKFPKPKL